MSSSTPVMDQWHRLKRSNPDFVLFFRMGDFYEFFYEDAERMSRILDLKLTSRGHDGQTPIPLAGIPYKALNEYLIRLIQKKIPVAVAEQVERSGKSATKFFRREIARLITPGTITDPDLLVAK